MSDILTSAFRVATELTRRRLPQMAGRVRLTPVSGPAGRVTLRLHAPAHVVGGFSSRFETIDREQRIQLLRYQGREALKVALPVIFDGWSDQASVEDELAALQRLHRPPADAHPPILEATGAMPHTDARWVVSQIEHEDPIWLPSGERCRQALTVTLTQWIAVDIGDNLSAAELSRQRAGTLASTSYTTVKGDTLEKLAMRAYRDKRRWRDLRKANRGVLHAAGRTTDLKPGLNLTVPA